MAVYLFVFVLISSSSWNNALENNVCRNTLDYFTIATNKHCWHNSDIGSSTDKVIIRHGYPCEIYDYVTEDGYINTIFRIPHNNVDTKRRRQSVLLQHGFMSNSVCFVGVGNRSLAFFLADQGFDVWIGNSRGTAYGKDHLFYTTNDAEYWNFSYHEIGLYDLPAEIDLISEKNGGKDKIIFIGHSMGTTESYIYAILKKEHAEKKLSGIISLCPIAFTASFNGIFSVLGRWALRINPIFRLFKIFAIMKNNTSVNQFCTRGLGIFLCKYIMIFSGGFDLEQIKAEDLPMMFQIGPTSISVKTILHFSQQINSGGRFQYFDYGPEENLLRYNSSRPPLYNVPNIELPVHLIYGSADFLANPKDVYTLYRELTSKDKSLLHISTDYGVIFSHMDFLMAKDVDKLLYAPLIKLMNEKFGGPYLET